MPFALFRDRCRDLADRETRTITQLQTSAAGLPAGQYAFVEMFCDEPACDCRRALFMVVSASGQREAVINFGWEDARFYAAWLHSDDPEMLAEIRGPSLQIGSPQGRHADAILNLAKELVLSDSAFVARVKRHYAVFREDVVRSSSPAPAKKRIKIGRNDPCPCGSGRKYKKCCEGKTPDHENRPPMQVQALEPSQVRITQEVDYIVEQALQGSGRIVRLDQIVFFSTAGGDAWLLDPEDGTALPLALAGARLPARVLEDEERFVIEWTHDYVLDGELFVAVERASGARRVFSGYPTAELATQ